MNIENRLEKLESKAKKAKPNLIVEGWLETLETDELLFLRDCNKSEQFQADNKTELDKINKKFYEYQEQASKT